MRRLVAAAAVTAAIAIGPGSAASEEPRIVFAAVVSDARYPGLNPGVDHVADLFTVRADGRGLRRLTRTLSWEDDPVWSPDRRRLAFTRGTAVCHGLTCEGANNASVWIAYTNGARPRRLTRPPAGYVDRGLAWSPDGRRVAFLRQYATDEAPEDGVYVIGASGRGLLRLHAGRIGRGRMSWSPDGRTLAVGLALLDVRSRAVTTLRTDVPGEPDAVAWSPNGRLLAVTTDKAVHVVPVAGGPSRRVVTARFIDGVAWSPDGSQLAFSGRRTAWSPGPGARLSPPRDIFVVSADGRGVRRVTSGPGAELSPSWG